MGSLKESPVKTFAALMSWRQSQLNLNKRGASPIWTGLGDHTVAENCPSAGSRSL